MPRFAASVAVLAVLAALTSFARAQDPALPRGDDPLLQLQLAPVQAAAANGIDVEVVDRDGKPAAGAIVAIVDFDPARVPMAQRQEYGQRVARHVNDEPRSLAVTMLEFGIRYRADEQGHVRVAPPSRRTGLMAVWGETGTQVIVAPDTKDKQRLVVEPQAKVAVHVVTADGAPLADAVVQLGVASDPFRTDTAASTDRSGNALLPIRRHLRAVGVQLAVRLPTGADTAPVQPIDASKPPSEPVAFTAPPTALLRVLALDDQGAPRNDVEAVRVVPLRTRSQEPLPPVRVDASGALFRVALGLDFECAARVHGAAGEWQRRANGPLQPGETTLVELRASMGPPLLQARVLGLDGAPVLQEPLAWVWQNETMVRSGEIATDAQGRVQLLLPTEIRGGGTFALLRRDRSPVSVPLGGAQRPLGAHLRPGGNDLGDIQLEAEPVLLAGRAVDETGAPIAETRLWFSTGWARDASSGSESRSGRQLLQHVVVTDRDGRFEVRDALTPPRVWLLRWQPGLECADAKTGYEPRRTDATVVLHRAGQLKVTLAELPANTFVDLQVYVAPPGGAPDTSRARPVQGGEALLQLPAGECDVVLRWSPLGADLVRVPNVLVPAGGIGTDPRLAPLPWREHFAAVALTVHGPDGAPARGIQVTRFVPSANGSDWTGAGTVTDRDGRAALLLPKSSGIVKLDGGTRYAGEVLRDVTADRTITLRALLRAQFDLRGELQLPKGASLQYVFEPIGEQVESNAAQLRLDNLVETVGAQGQSLVQRPGKHRLQLRAHVPQGAGAFATVDLLTQTIDIADVATLQTFALDVTPAMQQAVAAAAAKK